MQQFDGSKNLKDARSEKSLCLVDLVSPSETVQENGTSQEVGANLGTNTISIHTSQDDSQKAIPESYRKLIHHLVKNSGIYALASVLSSLVSFMLAPFLTRSLTLDDYGAFVLLNASIALIVGITQLGLDFAFFRVYNSDYEERKDRLAVCSTVVVILCLTSILVLIPGLVAAPQLSILLFARPTLSNPLRVATLVILCQNLTIPGSVWLRAENRSALFTLLSVGNSLINLGATFFFVKWLHLGITGSLLAVGCGYAFFLFCTLPPLLWRAGMCLRLDIVQNLLSFGVPHVFNFISYWLLQLSDRYLLGHLGSLSQAASYTVAYNLGGMSSFVVLAPFMLAWPAVMFAIAKRDDATHLFKQAFRWYSSVLFLATFGFTVAGTIVLDLFFPPSYHSAAPVIPIVALSMVFYGLHIVFCVGLLVQRKTWLNALLMMLAAIVNIAINLLLIPHYGSIGAAASTLIAYAFLALVAYIVNQRIYPVPFGIPLFLIMLALGIILYLGGCSLTEKTQILLENWGLQIGMFSLYAGCLIALGLFETRREKNLFS